jgi:hypothetical protein
MVLQGSEQRATEATEEADPLREARSHARRRFRLQRDESQRVESVAGDAPKQLEGQHAPRIADSGVVVLDEHHVQGLVVVVLHAPVHPHHGKPLVWRKPTGLLVGDEIAVESAGQLSTLPSDVVISYSTRTNGRACSHSLTPSSALASQARRM